MTDPEIIDALVTAHKKKRDRFTPWEEGFVDSIRDKKFLSDNMRASAQRILSEKSATKQDAAAARADQWHAATACDKCIDGIVVLRIALDEAQSRNSTRPPEHHFTEQAFACTCPKGELKKQWQGFPRNARDAWLEGWRTKDEWEAST